MTLLLELSVQSAYYSVSTAVGTIRRETRGQKVVLNPSRDEINAGHVPWLGGGENSLLHEPPDLSYDEEGAGQQERRAKIIHGKAKKV